MVKKALLALVLLATTLSISGCIVVPYPGYYYRPGWCYHPYRCY